MTFRAPSNVGVGVHGELDRPAGLVEKLPVGTLVAAEFHSVDREQVVALGDVHADLAEGRAVARLLVVALEDPRDPVTPGVRVPGEPRPRKAGAGPVRDLHVAALDVGVRDLEFGDHLVDHVVQVGPVLDVGQKRPVAGAQVVPVVAVQVPHVEEVAEPPPHLVEDLYPLGLRVPVRLEPGGGDRFLR